MQHDRHHRKDVRPFEFRGADIPTYADAFQGPWQTEHDQTGSGEVEIFNQGVVIGRDLVYNEHVGGALTLKGQLLGDTMALVIPDEETRSGRFWGRDYPESSAIILPPSHEIDVALPRMRSVVVMVQETDFRNHFTNACGRPPGCSSASPFLRLPPRSLQHLERRYSSIAMGRSSVTADISVCQEIAETLAMELPFENGTTSISPRSRSVREAILMFEERDPPPSVRRVAEELGVDQRTLRNWFVAATGHPPSRFLQIRQLNRAYRSLQSADPSRTTVTEVAMRFGFLELGRFAFRFRKLFGPLPSEVLNRRPPSHRSTVVLGAWSEDN